MLWTFNTDARIKECELRDNPIIITVNKFDEESAQEFCTQMSLAHCTGQEVIPIVIDSYGGQAYSLMRMISAIKASRLPVATIVEGKAMSCGAVLFSCGTEGYRFVGEHATVMLHEVSSVSWGKNEDIKANAKETDRLNSKLFKLMARNVGKPEHYFIDLLHQNKNIDLFFDSDDCVKHNLANKVGIPTFNISVQMNIEFRPKG